MHYLNSSAGQLIQVNYYSWLTSIVSQPLRERPATLLYTTLIHLSNAPFQYTQARSCLYIRKYASAYTSFSQNKKKIRKEKEKERALSVFQIIMCCIVLAQFLLFMSTQSNLKSFIKYA